MVRQAFFHIFRYKKEVMGKEFIRKDINGNDVYLKLERSEYKKTLINCCAYRKVTKKFFFIKYTVYKTIHQFNSDLWDTRCNWYTTTDLLDEKEVNRVLSIVMEQVNDSILKEEKHKKGLRLLNL